MKKLFISALALAAFTACSQDEIVEKQSYQAAIGFAGNYVNNVPRAAADPSTTTANIKAFDVWGYVKNSEGKVFEDITVNKTGDAWSYEPYALQYWVPGNTYRFFALAPTNTQNVTEFKLSDPFENGLGTITFTNVDGTEDLLYASQVVEATDATDKVKFAFDHLLSKVKFTFTNGFTTGISTIAVSNVKMVVPAEGTITLNEQDDYTWTLGEETVTLAFGNMSKKAAIAEGSKGESDNERLTIPAAATQEYTLTFDVELFQSGVSVLTDSKQVKINGCELKPGFAYNFTAILNQDNIGENPLKPIVFEAVVDEWEEESYDGGVIPTNAVSTAEELATALAEGGTITLVNDIDAATTTFAIAKNTILELNGHQITGADENVTGNYGLLNVNPDVTLTVNGPGTLTASATTDRVWSNYSSVISNQRGTLIVNEDVVIEHLGGTSMSYGIDNLTNTGAQPAITIINGATIKSSYRAIRQFLNSTTGSNELYVNAGSKIEGANKSIWSQNANAYANLGKLFVEVGAELKGDVMLSASNAAKWPVEVSIPVSTLVTPTTVVPSNVPAEYSVEVVDGVYMIVSTETSITSNNYDGNGETISAADNRVKNQNGIFKPTADATIEDVTIDGQNGATVTGQGYRGIYICQAGTYNVDKVTILNCAYAINVNTTKDVVLNISNSTLQGWSSYGASTTATFNKVNFTVGSYYAVNTHSSNDNGLFRPYGTTTLTDCDFANGFKIDFSQLSATETITFDGCTYAGQPITAATIAELADNTYDMAFITIK